jgi:hypothetical protein
VQEQLGLLRRFLTPDSCFLEIGAGDCALSLHLAERVHQVYALDVSETISRESRVPANFRLILSDGVSVPVLAGQRSQWLTATNSWSTLLPERCGRAARQYRQRDRNRAASTVCVTREPAHWTGTTFRAPSTTLRPAFI